MQVNFSTLTMTKLYKAPMKLLPFITGGLLLSGAMTSCDKFEKRQKEFPQVVADRVQNDTFVSQTRQENEKESVKYEKSRFIEYDEDGCHVKCEYDENCMLRRVEKYRLNNNPEVDEWYKSIRTYDENGDFYEIISYNPSVKEKSK